MGFNTLCSIFKAVPDNCMFLSFITQWPWGIWLYWLNSCHSDHSSNHVCTYLSFITKLSARNKNWLTSLEHLTLKLSHCCRSCVFLSAHTLLVKDRTQFCLQNCLYSSWHAFSWPNRLNVAAKIKTLRPAMFSQFPIVPFWWACGDSCLVLSGNSKQESYPVWSAVAAHLQQGSTCREFRDANLSS